MSSSRSRSTATRKPGFTSSKKCSRKTGETIDRVRQGLGLGRQRQRRTVYNVEKVRADRGDKFVKVFHEVKIQFKNNDKKRDSWGSDRDTSPRLTSVSEAGVSNSPRGLSHSTVEPVGGRRRHASAAVVLCLCACKLKANLLLHSEPVVKFQLYVVRLLPARSRRGLPVHP